MSLKCVLSREALLAVTAGEGLHCQVYALMSLQVVISVERLRALVTLERSVILLLLLPGVARVHVLSHMLRGIALHIHAPHERHLVARAVNIGHDWT